MLNFTDNLYRSQWLDLVFQNRNKAYGAYSLRLNNSVTTTRAFLIANGLFISLIVGTFMYQKTNSTSGGYVIASPPDEVTEAKIYNMPLPAAPPAQAKLEKTKLKTIKYTQPLVVPSSQVTEEPASQKELSVAVIASHTSEGEESVAVNEITSTTASGNGTAEVQETAGDDGLHSPEGLARYPEFPGGQSAFAKYLSRNLKYPGTAADANIEGKVLVSFVIERDGQLSNIKILRGIGYGCDEEAIRVLKKSPRWTPGEQNLKSVRVAYTLPINFKLPD